MTDNVGEKGSPWRTEYEPGDMVGLRYVPGRRKAVRPKWGGHHGAHVKGSIRWEERLGGYFVTYSFLLGFESTTKKGETFKRWNLAMGQYREHDRAVREKQRLENFRAAQRVL